MSAIDLVRDDPDRQRFEIPLGDEFAVLEYRWHEGKLALMHTAVPPEHEGKGYAGALVKFALDKARAENRKILPYCPYVSAYLVRHPEYQDLVAERST